MIARVARFEGVNVEKAEATMDEAERIIRPIVEGMAGCRGFIELMSAGGEMLSITLFDSEASAQAAEPIFDEEMPRQLGPLFQSWEGRRVSAGHFDVVADERMGR